MFKSSWFFQGVTLAIHACFSAHAPLQRPLKIALTLTLRHTRRLDSIQTRPQFCYQLSPLPTLGPELFSVITANIQEQTFSLIVGVERRHTYGDSEACLYSLQGDHVIIHVQQSLLILIGGKVPNTGYNSGII